VDEETNHGRNKNNMKKPLYWKRYDGMEQKSKKYARNWKRKIDKHEKKMELSMWMDESTYQIARKSKRRYFRKTMNQWT